MRPSLKKFIEAIEEAENDSDREALVAALREEIEKLRNRGSATRRYLLLSLKDHLLSERLP
jgi:hypothetical protein